ncbi:hypothetical protein H072_4881 [Dactylellina haptotyla CBS 200.50]|uniref:DUF1740-domain-containing protein n=1 Tax=Dactylellina haptotyla (strain CBS 200.50) TaxID=1284197 RepID=S8AE15_DACHA|nr:hypothetical protein H072_4881 [Dactylellina haptotyla CBS 200.50]
MASPPPETDDDKPTQAKKVPQFKSFVAPTAAKSKPVPQFGSFKPSSASSASSSSSTKPKSEEPRSREYESRRRHHDRERDRDRERSKRDGSSERQRRHDKDDRDDRDRKRRSSRDRERDSHRGDRDKDDERTHSRRHRHRHSRSRSKSPRYKGKDGTVTLHSAAHDDPSILPWDTPSQPYLVDRKGDPHNITYGTIHRYNIPKYWRYGKGGVVGLGRSFKIESDKGDGKGLVVGKTGGGKGSGRLGARGYAVEESRQLRVKIAGDDENKGFVEGWNFVELPSKASKKKKLDDEGAMEDRDYRSIEGMQRGVSRLDVDEDLEEIGSSEDELAAFDANIKERTVILSRLVGAEPNNIDAWFSLMEHQEIIIYGNKERRRRKVRQGERQSLEEVKLGILDKALAKNEGNPRLLLAYMKIADGIWESPKIKAKWEDIISKNSTMIALWQGYINFRQADFVSFKYKECLKVYEDCIDRLRGRILRYGTPDDEKAKLEEILLYIITRASAYMDQAGFSELSLAVWQGILELQTAPPKAFASGPNSLTDHENMLDSFGAFWDSEVLRIGEPKAKGWASYADQDIGEFADPKDLPEDYSPGDDLRLGDPDFFGAWLDKEKPLLGKLPARTTDEVEEDDPFRVILFSDIRSFLWKFQSPIAKERLGDAFIAFTGIVAPGRYQNDSFFRMDLAKSSEANLAKWFWHDTDVADVKLITWVDGLPMESERRGRVTRNPFLFRSSCLSLDSETLIPSSWWFSSVEVPDQRSERLDFFVSILKEYVLRLQDERLALIYFAVEYRRNPGNNKKVAKQLLKKYSDSLKLWDAYAMSETAQGNREAAKSVYQTALKMSTSFSSDQQRFAIGLWRSWIWNEIDEGHEDVALGLLLTVPDGHAAIGKKMETSPAALLKSRRFLEEQQHRMYSLQDFEPTVAYAELHSLFLFLSAKDKEPTVFLKPLDDLIVDLHDNSDNSYLEKAYLSKSRIFYHYAVTARPYKAAVFRGFLESASKRFPDNTAILSLFVWNESRSKIEYRVRTMLVPDTTSNEETGSIVKWVFSIWAEMQMSAGRKMNENAVRSLFERAVESEHTKFSIQLWLLYLQFELRQSQPKRAKDVFFRAVRACPWSKDIILSGFRWLRSVLDFGEMRKVYGVMQERELRVHVDIEEVLEEWDKDAVESGQGRPSIIGSGVSRRITLPDDEDSDMEGV